MDEAGSEDYCTRIVRDLDDVGAEAWNALLAQRVELESVRRFEFLHALHDSGSASMRTGWEPHYLTLWRSNRLCAAVPLYRKHHSYGEYVFDWAWADAHQRHGVEYYPKWLVAVPFTPVPGPRLLALDDEARDRVASALVDLVEKSALSSLHVLFPTESEARSLAQARRTHAPVGPVPLVQPRLRDLRRLPCQSRTAQAQEGAGRTPQGGDGSCEGAAPRGISDHRGGLVVVRPLLPQARTPRIIPARI